MHDNGPTIITLLHNELFFYKKGKRNYDISIKENVRVVRLEVQYCSMVAIFILQLKESSWGWGKLMIIV